jgi:hypothetical protein
MKLPELIKVEWENGDITIERPISETIDGKTYRLDESIHGNFWAYKSMCCEVTPAADAPSIRIGQIFTVDGKKYVIINPATSSQLENTNDHGQLVITLFDI